MNPTQKLDSPYRSIAESLTRFQADQIKHRAVIESLAFDLTCLKERLRALEALLDVPFEDTLSLEEWELEVSNNDQ